MEKRYPDRLGKSFLPEGGKGSAWKAIVESEGEEL